MNIKKMKRYENGILKFENGWYHFNNKYGEMYQICKEENDKGWSISEYKSGKEKLYGFFVGEIMKASSGKANPKLVNDILKEKLKK